MSITPGPGMPVVVLQPSPPVQWQGVVVALKDTSLAIRLHEPPTSWDGEQSYIVICGTPGSRASAPARFVATNGPAAAFRLTGSWKQLDLRSAPRFATDLKAEVRSVLGSSRQPGRVVDISLGGAAVAVDVRPGGSQIELGIAANGYSARLLCDVLNVSQHGADTVLHVRFHEMSAPHQAFVRQLVGSLVDAEARRAAS